MSHPTASSRSARQLPDAVLDGLAALSHRAESSRSLFAAPIGPAADGLVLPRYVAFGRNASDDAPRIALLAGFDRTDSAASTAVLSYLGVIADRPDLAGGVVLDATPLVNRADEDLWSAAWILSERSELNLLEREFRRLPPHALIAIRTMPAGRPVYGELRGLSLETWLDGAGAVLASLHWIAPTEPRIVPDGITGLIEDLPQRPLEIWLTLPEADADGAIVILHAVMQRIRALLSYAQHL